MNDREVTRVDADGNIRSAESADELRDRSTDVPLGSDDEEEEGENDNAFDPDDEEDDSEGYPYHLDGSGSDDDDSDTEGDEGGDEESSGV